MLLRNSKISRGGGQSLYVIIIASYAFEVIYEQIKSIGIDVEVYIYLLYDPCHLKKTSLYTASEKQDIYHLFSKECYTDKLLQFILVNGFLNKNGFDNIKNYLGYGGIDAYYYDGIANKIRDYEEKLTLLDVGSYTGDSILQMKSVFYEKIKRIYAFEPSRENYEKIIRKNIDNLTLYKLGLSNHNGYMRFSEKGPFFRASGKENGILAQVAKLDDLKLELEGRCILKIDIEGSEMDCLEGAREFIKTNKPYIAVCVYHKERDILDIPVYIKGLVSEYHFYLRGGMHTVCYAFPERIEKDECN